MLAKLIAFCALAAVAAHSKGSCIKHLTNNNCFLSGDKWSQTKFGGSKSKNPYQCIDCLLLTPGVATWGCTMTEMNNWCMISIEEALVKDKKSVIAQEIIHPKEKGYDHPKLRAAFAKKNAAAVKAMETKLANPTAKSVVGAFSKEYSSHPKVLKAEEAVTKKFEKKETKTKFAYKSGGLMKNPKVAKELAKVGNKVEAATIKKAGLMKKMNKLGWRLRRRR